ncbi:MAG: ATP-binding cassette domain-containing protein [Chloroflexi bacterium]|nr:ATP-binding cassette domain-containing protein [Chloroflexota bacterium]
MRNIPHDVSEPRKKELLSFCRLEPFRQRHAEHLSGGMQKKLALACSLIHEPEVIFLDEPTTGVDPVSRRDFWRIISSFLSRGITILVSTPYLDEAERFNRVAFIHRGQIIACDTPQNLKATLAGELLQIRASSVERALAILKQTNSAAPQLFGNTIHIIVDDARKRRPEVEHLLEQNNIKVEDIRSVPPGLEDVFVSRLGTPELSEQKREGNLPGALAGEKEAGEIAIRVENLTRRFGDFAAVDSVSFEVKRGEIFGLLGPNGSGKTTTIRMITGLLLPTSGSAYVLGQDMAAETASARSKMGYMSQRFSLFADLTVEENIDLYGGLYGLSALQLAEGKRWVLDMAGLRGKEKLMPLELSGGWKQRLALGCAIIHSPEVIFLDEPTAGVDPVSRRSFWELIQELAVRGTAVLITTHYMDEAEHCHRLGMFYQGKLIAVGSPQQLKAEQVKGELLEVLCSDYVRALELLSADARYHQVSLFGTAIHVEVDDVSVASPEIKRLLESGRIAVSAINRIPFTLEDVFISVVEKYEGQGQALVSRSTGKGA